MALNKEVYSDFDMEYLRKLTPIQNDGISAREIANISRRSLLHKELIDSVKYLKSVYISKYAFNRL